jgi:ribosomal protein S12 methylthiotransferase
MSGQRPRRDRRSSAGPRAGVISLGCPKNLVDTEYLLGSLTDAGYALVNDLSQADLILVNTCSFLGSAVEESNQAILEALEEKRRRPMVRVVVEIGRAHV